MFSKTKKIKAFIYTISFLLFISGCQKNPLAPTSVVEMQNTATMPATVTEIHPSLTPAATPTSTTTPTSTATSTNTPTSTPTPIPPVIGVGNIDNLTRSSWGGDASFVQIAWSPDGQQLLLATTDEIQWLDPQTLDALNVIPTGASLSGTEFDATTSTIAIGNYGAIEIWDLDTASPRFSLEGHNTWIRNKVFSPDGQVLASAWIDGIVRLWDMNTGELQYEFTDIALPSKFEEPNEFTELSRADIDISPDGESLVMAVSSRTYLPERNSYHHSSNIQIFDLQTGVFQRILKEYRNGAIFNVTFSPDGQIIGVYHQVGPSAATEFIDSTTGALIDSVPDIVADVVFAPDMSMVGLSYDIGIMLRDIHNNETVGLLEVPSLAYTIVFSPDSTKIAAMGSGWIRIWDVETQEVLQTKQLDSYFRSMSLNPISHIVATKSDGTLEIQLHDLQTGQILQTLTDPTTDERYTTCLIFSPDNQYLARCIEDVDIGFIEMWDIANGHLMYTINIPFISWERDSSFSPDGKTFVVSVGTSIMMSYDVVTGQLSDNNNFSTEASSRVYRFTYSPDGRFIAAQGEMPDVNPSQPAVLVFASESRSQIISVPTDNKSFSILSFIWHSNRTNYCWITKTMAPFNLWM